MKCYPKMNNHDFLAEMREKELIDKFRNFFKNPLQFIKTQKNKRKIGEKIRCSECRNEIKDYAFLLRSEQENSGLEKKDYMRFEDYFKPKVYDSIKCGQNAIERYIDENKIEKITGLFFRKYDMLEIK